MNKNRLRHMAAVWVATSLILLSNAGNPPTGQTGAPFDGGSCGGCHNGGSYSGSVSVNGLPATIQPNQVYNLDVTITGNAPFGGFQMVAVDGANANCGNLTASGQAGTEFLSGREYVEQRGRKAFSGGSVTWNFTWQAPASSTPPSGNQVKFYMCGNMVNGTNGTGGDVAVTALETVPYAGAAAVNATISNTTNVTCFGLANGTATASASGGTGVFSYLWSNGQTAQTATNLGPGNYTVTVTSGAATATASTNISQPTTLNATATGGTLNCTNTVVNISANASGGTGPYTVSWSNGNSGSPTSVSAPGTYTATVTDANSCTKTAVTTVTSNITPPSANAGPTQVLGSNGTAILNGNGSSTGTQYSYLWTASAGGNIQSGATTLMPVVNAAGTYTLQVTNNTNGCTSTASTTVTQTFTIPVAEAGNNFTITCTTTPPYSLNGAGSSTGPEFSYQWSAQGSGSILSGGNTLTPTISGAGTYGLIVTNVLSGLTATDVVTVSENTTVPTASAQGGTITCATTCTTLTASSTTPGAVFSWSSGSTQVCQAGIYTVTVTNPANGCSATAQATVVANSTAPSASISPTNPVITCTNSSVQVTASSNTNGATFTWFGSNGNPIATGSQYSASTPGTYTVVVSDPANGCTSSSSVTVTANTNLPTVTVTPAQSNLTCATPTSSISADVSISGGNFSWTLNGNAFPGSSGTITASAAGTYVLTYTAPNGCTGSATATVSGSTDVPQLAVAPSVIVLNCSNPTSQLVTTSNQNNLTFAWAGPGGFSSNEQNPTVSTPGTYTVVATNPVSQCSASQTVTLTQDANLPTVTASGGTLLCNSTGVQLNASGSTISGSYAWTGPNNYANANQNPTVTTPGTYAVVFTNTANGCTASATATVGSDTNAPTLSLNQANTITCTNTTTEVCASSNVPGTLIGWTGPNGFTSTSACFTTSTPGAYTAIAAAPNGCVTQSSINLMVDQTPPELTVMPLVITCTNPNPNINTAATSSTPGAIVTVTQVNGQYVATATGTNGCISTATIPVSTDTNVPTLSVTGGELTCVTTSVTLVATTTTSGAVLSWPSLVVTDPGVYTVTATSPSGCTATATATVTQNIQTPTVNCTSTGLNCQGLGQVAATSAAGVVLSWSGGMPGQNPLPVNTPGTYTVTATNSMNGCTGTCSVVVSPATNSLQLQVMATPTCQGNYALGVTVLGGTPPFAYNWSPALPPGPLNPGNYSLTVTDADGCSLVENIQLAQLPPVLAASVVSITNPTTGANGAIDINTTGGAGLYTYLWLNQNGQSVSTSEDPTGLPTGTYSVTATDANGCTVTIAGITLMMVGTNDLFEQSLRVYPVPANNVVHIETDCQTTIEQVFITDLAGRQLFEQAGSGCHLELSVNSLPAGTYQLRIVGSDRVTALRPLVIQR